MCIYYTTIFIGDELIKPQIEEKSAAKEQLDEVKRKDLAAFRGTSISNGCVELELENVQEGVVVTVEVKLWVVANLSDRDSLFFKFPLQVGTSLGRVDTLMEALTSQFSFEFDYSLWKDKIADLTCNSATGNDNQVYADRQEEVF